MPPPDDYAALILIPAILHIDPMTFAEYPEALQRRIRMLLQHYLAHGWAGPGPDRK